MFGMTDACIPRYQALWSPPVSVFSTVGVRAACRVRLRVRAREVEPPTAS